MSMPVFFIGHGSPMNTIENNLWVRNWRLLGKELLKDKEIKGIVMISAHWYVEETYITKQENPEIIYDMYGFPDILYDVEYPAVNNLELRDKVYDKLKGVGELNGDWGYDHGSYSILYNMFPKADLPVLQVSINSRADAKYHYELGKLLKPLRDENILIIGSGNVVHNLGLMSVTKEYPWAKKFDKKVQELIINKDYEALTNLERTNEEYSLAAPTSDHIHPLMVCLGAIDDKDKIQIINDEMYAGSLSMTSFLWGFNRKI